MKRWTQDSAYNIPGFRFHVALERLDGGAWEERSPEFGRLVLIRRGAGVHICGDGEFPVATGDVFYVFPGAVHGYRDIARLELFDILFDHSIFLHPHPELIRMPGYRAIFHDGPNPGLHRQLSSRLRLEGPALNRALELIDAMRTEYESRYPGCEAAIRSLLVMLVTHFARQYAEQRSICTSTVVGLARAATYMETNYRENVRLEDVVDEACMSRSSFMRSFRALYQTSPLKYLNEIRLKKAAYRLKWGTESITEIALGVGYSDPNHFSRLFRQFYGVSPRQFRAARRV